jgi:hypothetical protein
MLEQKYNKLSKEEKLIFLAGVFEGEGSFGFWGKEEKHNRYLRVQVRMCDEDIVRRFIDYFRLGSVTTNLPKKELHSRSWKWTVAGDKAIEVMLQLVPFLGIRRQEKFTQCCQSYKQSHPLQKSYLTQSIKQSLIKISQLN